MKILKKNHSAVRKSRSKFQSFSLRATVMIAGLAAVFGPATAFGRPLGIDVSNHNGSGINWSSVAASGVTFAWTKATEGTYFIDADFTSNESNAKAAGIKMGAYHFAQPGLTSPGSEENYFWAEAGSYITADGKTLMPMLDMETWNGVVGASSYSGWANAWCSAAVSDASAQGVTITPFIYVSACNACYFDSSVSGWLADIASYNGQSSSTGTPWNTCTSCEVWGSSAWDVWQYTSSGSVSGISGNVDMDVYNGTASDLTSAAVATGNVSWHDWSSLGGILTSAPSACSYGPNNLDVYVRGTDNQIWQRSWSSTGWTAVWSEHSFLPNGLTAAGAPAASANNKVSGREDLYAIGTDGNCYHDWWAPSSGWRGWQNIGQPSGVSLVGAPAATSWGAGRYDVVAVGTDGATYHTYYDPTLGWIPWQSLGGLTQYDPTACSWGTNRLDIYVNGSGLIYHKYWQGSTWIDWYEDLPEIRTSYALGTSSWGTGRIDMFANYGGTIRHCWYNGSKWAADWSEQHPGVTATSAACATSWGVNRIDVFVRGSDNACHHMYWGQ